MLGEPTVPVLEIDGLRVGFPQRRGLLEVVHDATFRVLPGEIVGLVGESGSGKTVTCMSAIGLLGAIGATRTAGRVAIDGADVTHASRREWDRLRMDVVSMIFQQPRRSLNPAFTVGDQIAEPLRVHQRLSRRAARDRAVELLDRVGLDRPAQRAREYPFQLSGGMCQRVMIAAAVSCEPKVLIADEPTTALDVTVQARILDLLAGLRDDLGIGILYVTHDLAVVRDICDTVVTMYAGEVVETGPADAVFAQPRHPYTAGLLASTMQFTADGRLRSIVGQVPSPAQLPSGCRFHPRCEHCVEERCTTTAVALREVDGGPRQARCVRADELELAGR